MTNVVSFPGLGLSVTLSRVAFQVFGRNIYWYGVIIAAGFLCAVALCSRWAPRFGISSEQIMDMLLFAVPMAILGLRTYYVVFNLDLYRRADGSLDVPAMLRLSDGGLAIYGGILAAVLTLILFCRRRRISFPAFADLGVHGLLIGQSIGRWGNFMNVEAYGGICALPWRMSSPSITRALMAQGLAQTEEVLEGLESGALGVHPTFLYESLWNFIGIFLIYFLGKYARRFDGQIFLTYLCWYGLGRFWIEGLRTDSLYFFGLSLFGVPVRTSQALALLSALCAGIVLCWQMTRPHDPSRLYVNQIRRAQPECAEQNQPTEGE